MFQTSICLTNLVKVGHRDHNFFCGGGQQQLSSMHFCMQSG